MAKVNVDLFRQLQTISREALSIWGEALRLLDKQGLFCDECGEVAPKNGFYPLIVHGPSSVSGLTCNDCDREIRARIKREKKQNGKTTTF